MKQLLNSRFKVYFFVLAIFLAYNFLIRTTLLLISWDKISLSFKALINIYGNGLFYDLISSFYATVVIVLYLVLMPNKLYHHPLHRYVSYLFFIVVLFALGFLAISEHVFWEEFSVRFNFIAVDYLVYTQEVIGNIMESYPVWQILAVNFGVSLVVFYFLKGFIDKALMPQTHFSYRAKYGVVLLLLPLLAYFLVTGSNVKSDNQYEKNLSYNGLYQLFSAFINNKLEYSDFYATIDEKIMLKNYRTLMEHGDSAFVEADMDSMKRIVKGSEHKSEKNVVIVLMESMSSEFMGVFGNKAGLTPNLDRLANEGLLFTNFFATGTRTVRGMEAITLSIPPLAGRSVVKQPDGVDMFSSGYLFKEHGYNTSFIYGGHGYFDNMNAFFAANGFNDIVDKTEMNSDEITFSNVWGVSDENLFDKAIKKYDSDFAAHKKFFSLVMTTSNHRPYTYPDGKIDIPSHSGRSGAVKYADFAVGELIRKAQTKPWFNDTIFVFVADHCASSAGKTELPMHKYKIPFIMYAPSLVQPQKVNKMSSQIDVVPTLLGVLGWNYESRFYGDNILSDSFIPRAFIGTYQKLGLLRDDTLTILLPNKKVREYKIMNQSYEDSTYRLISPLEKDALDAITYFQSESYFHKHRLDRVR
jgi:phosphoglycerol transferase MdoB-like AlkP superfamily enzyme